MYHVHENDILMHLSADALELWVASASEVLVDVYNVSNLYTVLRYETS